MIHRLKTWPEPFAAVKRGEKTHEVRREDRPFAVGDVLHLEEWIPDDVVPGCYTGDALDVLVTHVTHGGEWGLPADLCVMSIMVLRPITVSP